MAPIIAPSSFTQSATLLRRGIDQMAQFLVSQQKPYLNVHRFLSSESSAMSDDDRDALELTVAKFAKEYQVRIDELAKSIPSVSHSQNRSEGKHSSEHQHYVTQSLLSMLQSMTESMLVMKQALIAEMKAKDALRKAKNFQAKYSGSQPPSQPHLRAPSQAVNDTHNNNHSHTNTGIDANNPLHAELLQENSMLLNSLQGDVDAIQRAEAKAHDIANLITLFHSKVLEQNEQIDRIDANTVESTSMIESGIEQLRKAATRGANFRMIILFVILVLSFSLLFLDWYTP